MPQRIKTLQVKMKTHKVIELVIGTIVAAVVTLQLITDGVTNILSTLPEVFK
jgi:hypothetical protein